jgi:hypothetical protein
MGNSQRVFGSGFVSVLFFSAVLAGGGSGPVATHGQTPCPTCHTLRADATTPSEPRADFDRQCRNCHSGTPSESLADGFSFHSHQERACLDCHSFHDPSVITAGGRSFRLEYHSLLLRFQCGSCHNRKGDIAKLGNGHRQAAVLYHSDLPLLTAMSPSDKCLICHSRQSIPLPIPDTDVAPPRFSEHASHPFGVPVRGGIKTSGGRIRPQIDPQMVLLNDRIECQTCHCLTSENTQANTAADRPSQSVCLGCHIES